MFVSVRYLLIRVVFCLHIGHFRFCWTSLAHNHSSLQRLPAGIIHRAKALFLMLRPGYRTAAYQ